MIKYFSLPDYWNHFFEIQGLIMYRQLHPEYFYSDRIFNSAYGFPPNLVWNGGRIMLNINYMLTYDTVFNYFSSLPDFHLRHTCTNLLIDDVLIKDSKCNFIIDNYYLQKDYIIIASNILHKYLLAKGIQPNHFIYSTSLGITDIEQINKYSQNNLFVLNYMQNNDNHILEQLQTPNNIEILCAELCLDNCPHRQSHYLAVSKVNAKINLNMNESANCILEHPYETDETNKTIEWYLSNFKHAVSNERINELSEKFGIYNFKISGRGRSNILYLRFIIYYLVLPQYREQVLDDIILEIKKLKIKYKLSQSK